MTVIEGQQTILDILKNLRDLAGLMKLFWTQLNFTRENRPISVRPWPEGTRNALAEDPILFASGGQDGAFHIIYCPLASETLQRGLERPIVNHLLREHPYALFVFSNKNRSAWHFLNVKLDEKDGRHRLFRRITVGPGTGLRTAAERIQLLDLDEETATLPPLAIQSRCDEAFDVEKVTKEFFKEIANWYFWALRHARFPKDAPKEADGHDHIGVIRLITRLVFCWFVKEKGLIPDALFDGRRLAETLVGFAPDKASNKDSAFYRAILQNLFFATLNTEMDKRGWAREDQNFMAHTLYRFKECFRQPGEALDLFKSIPFLNGGLFECLDKDLGDGVKPRYVRIDGFSRRPDSQAVVPDFLFFGEEQEADLSKDYGDNKFKKARVRGLIETLNRYKFTIEENTPIEQDVALDPELCGKIFENLLAAYNPETGATARKQTGSFYTPREIVDYMVDEALIAHLTPALSEGEGSGVSPSSGGGMGEVGKVGWKTTDAATYAGVKEFTIQNRQNQTEAEEILWQRLRNRQIGMKFRRQHPIGKYIADFVCLERKIIIEADGQIHEKQKEADAQRDRSLLANGYHTIRFANEEILHNTNDVIRRIEQYIASSTPLEEIKGKSSPPPLEGVGGRLRRLFSWNEISHDFSDEEADTLIDRIDGLKALDPAVGSGAFPMGILHKLVFVLGKLDPGNKRWKARQIAKMEDAVMREEAERIFRDNEDNYGRKLYLIENCIYGVDIQSIAVQIAKMRFFISLIVDQKVDAAKPNLGVLALPNLETNFAAANTLIGIEKPDQGLLRNQKIDAKEAELRMVREKHFNARTPASKAKCREQDRQLRGEIADLLKSDGWNDTTARQLAAWDPYDQNSSAAFFDPEWMFGITNGFDVCIGNPPYLNVELVDAKQKAYYAEHYATFYKRYDVFGLFYEAALMQLASPRGNVSFIVPQQIANNLSYKKLRDLMLNNRWLREVLYLGDKIFRAANNDVCVLFLSKQENSSIRLANALDFERWVVTEVPTDHFTRYGNVISFSGDAGGEKIFAKIFSPDRWRINDQFTVFQGIVTGNNEAFLPTAEQIREAKIEKEILHPVLLGRDFEKWHIRGAERRIIYADADTDIGKYPNTEKWLHPFRSELKKRRECVRGVIPWYSLQWPRVKSELDRAPKILVQRTRNPRLATRIVATIDEVGIYGMESIIFIILRRSDAPIYFLLAVLNSTLINYLYATKFLNVAVKAEYLKDTPIPKVCQREQDTLSNLARRILAAKAKNPEADTSALEREIDRIVYSLYGLTPEEIEIVEGANS